MRSQRSLTNNAGEGAAHILSQEEFSDSFSQGTNMASPLCSVLLGHKQKRVLKKSRGRREIKGHLEQQHLSTSPPTPNSDNILQV